MASTVVQQPCKHGYCITKLWCNPIILCVTAVIDVSLASSLLRIPFSTNPGALTISQCSAAPR